VSTVNRSLSFPFGHQCSATMIRKIRESRLKAADRLEEQAHELVLELTYTCVGDRSVKQWWWVATSSIQVSELDYYGSKNQ
jgi:hypothetical protein